MSKALSKSLVAFFIALVSVIVCGCGSSHGRSNVFLLLPDQALVNKAEEFDPVTVNKVTIPSYLNRREMVRVMDGDRVETMPRTLWAEHLDIKTKQVLQENFAYRIKASAKATPIQIDYLFHHYELKENGRLVLDAECQAGSNRQRFTFEIPSEGYANPARMYGKALSQLVDETIAWLKQNKAGK